MWNINSLTSFSHYYIVGGPFCIPLSLFSSAQSRAPGSCRVAQRAGLTRWINPLCGTWESLIGRGSNCVGAMDRKIPCVHSTGPAEAGGLWNSKTKWMLIISSSFLISDLPKLNIILNVRLPYNQVSMVWMHCVIKMHTVFVQEITPFQTYLEVTSWKWKICLNAFLN